MEFLKSNEYWLTSVGVCVGLFLSLLFLHKIVLRQLYKLALKSKSDWDNELIKAMRRPLVVLYLLVSLSAGATFLPASIKAEFPLATGVKIAFVLLMSWIADRVMTTSVAYGEISFLKESTTKSLLKTFLRTGIVLIAGILSVDLLGISISPFIASLGVGSLAIALALQETLGNFFSGIYLQMDSPIRVGDFVRIEPNIEGYIENIGWRSTRIRVLSNNLVVVPNSKMATSNLINYNLPSQDLAVLIEVGVAYDSDLKKVEEVTIAAAKEVLARVPGAIADFEPFIRFHTLADSSINFTVIMRAKTFVDNYLLKHEFIKKLLVEYGKAGIEIPFPQRTLHIPQGIRKEVSL